MMERAEKWTKEYFSTSFRTSDPFILWTKQEVFLFNAWAAWNYCLERDLIANKTQETATEFIASVAVHSERDKDLDLIRFFELFQSRFAIYKKDIRGMLNSNYPKTKMYFPVQIYCAFYHNQYHIDVLDDIDPYDIIDEMDDFMPHFIKHWNSINKDMEKSWGK